MNTQQLRSQRVNPVRLSRRPNRFASTYVLSITTILVSTWLPARASAQHWERGGSLTGVVCPETRVRVHTAPIIKASPPPQPTSEEAAHIRTLIRELGTLSDTAPVAVNANSETWFDPKPLPDATWIDARERENEEKHIFGPLKELASLGPRVIPFLLDSLQDKTPTHVSIGPFSRPTPVSMVASTEIPFNPRNVREAGLVAAFTNTTMPPAHASVSSHVVTVGDLCFVTLGQIVRRGYRPVETSEENAVVITSPSSNPAIARCVRAIWAGKNPAQVLMDSLLCDLLSPSSVELSGWHVDVNNTFSDSIQLNAAIRLAYYFPRETAPMFMARLKYMRSNLSLPPANEAVGQYRELPYSVNDSDFIEAARIDHDEDVQAEMRSVPR